METSGNRKIFVGIPRERFSYNGFNDNRDQIFSRLQELDLFSGYYTAEGHRVDRNRTEIVKFFLAHPDKPEWLLQLDSDMEHPIQGAEILLAAAEERNAKVIGGLYFHRGKDHQPFVFKYAHMSQDEWGRPSQLYTAMRDEVYDFMEMCGVPMRDGPFVIVEGAPMDPVVRCDAVATGFLLVHRSIFERMEPPWFDYSDPTQSEDLLFCDRVNKELGEPIYCHIGVVSGHYIPVPIGQAQFRTIFASHGFSTATIDIEDAREWLKTWLSSGNPEELDSYTTDLMKQVWNEKERNTPADVMEFYRDEIVGEEYLKDLIRWNNSDMFTAFRQALIPMREMRVLEVGPGIGTVSVQMAFQRNHVLAVEPNPILNSFVKYRWNQEVEQNEGVVRIGTLQVLDDLDDIPPEVKVDLAIAIDVIEHIHPDDLTNFLKKISSHLVKRGRLFMHVNFGQQDIFPFHYDHSAYFEKALGEAGLFALDANWAIKLED